MKKGIEIKDIVDLIRSADYYGGGEAIEIAKGKNQLVTSWAGMIRKLKRRIKE
jgi:hypothetical protein